MIANNTTLETNTYWNIIKDVKDEVKLRLITLLSESLTRSVREKETVVSDRTADFLKNVYGSWKGPETAEEIIAVINDSKSCKNPVSFDDFDS